MASARAVALTLTAAGLAGVLASCTSTANISDVYTALDANGDRKRTTFYTDSTSLHCVVEAGIGRPDATIDVLVRQLQGYDLDTNNFYGTNRVTANIENLPAPATGVQKIDMSIAPLPPDGTDASTSGNNDIPFQAGHFACEAYLDGQLQQTAIFNVDFPPCPTSFITPGSACYGYYRATAVCKRYGDSSNDPKGTLCHCTKDMGWACDP